MNTEKTIIRHRGVKTSVLAIAVLVAFGIGIAIGMSLQRTYYPCVELPVVTVERDTVFVTDTVRNDVPVPQIKYRTRTDTVRIEISPQDGTGRPVGPDTPADTGKSNSGQQIDVQLPIEAKVYQTDDYRAVVSGFRPSLDSMEVYRKAQTIRETVTKVQTIRPRWVLTAGGGVGYTTERQVVPHVGITLGWAIWSSK